MKYDHKSISGANGFMAQGDLRMDEAHRLSALIASIYDAALDASLWPDVLRRAAKFVDGSSAAIFAKEATGKSGFIAYDDGVIMPHYKQLYFENYIRIDPTTVSQFFGEIDEPASVVDFMPLNEFLESRFYLEWVKPQGLVDFATVVLDKSVTGAAFFGVFRHEIQGLVSPEMRRLVRLIAPHIRRSVLIGRIINLKTAESESFASVFDGLASAMFLLDAKSAIVHANEASLALLSQGDVIRSVAGKLEAADPKTNNELQKLLRDATEGDLALGSKGISMPLVDRFGAHLVAHIMPLSAGLRAQEAVAFRAKIAIFIRPVQLEAAAPPEIIAKTFGLTPTELRIMLAIVEVGGVPEVAVNLGIAQSTVKTHISRLYEKTGARRHTDLAKIFSAFTTQP